MRTDIIEYLQKEVRARCEAPSNKFGIGCYYHIEAVVKNAELLAEKYGADKVVQMDAYHARDITAQAKAALEGHPVPDLTAPGFHLPTGNRVIDLSGDSQPRKNYRGDGYRQERLKVKCFGKTAFSVVAGSLDLRYVEQLVDGEQTQALAQMVRYARENLAGLPVPEVVGMATNRGFSDAPIWV